jgi:putative peptidoglycan lipid II flippase
VSGATAFSRVLGLIREQVMAYFFGAGMATDAFVTAFRIPNLLRDMFAEGALSSAFVPVFKEKLVKESDQEAFKLADIMFTAIFLVVGLIVILGVLAAPVVIYLTAYGFTEHVDKFALTVDLTRIMMIYLLFVSLSALVMGMLNSFGRFAVPALSPAMFNLGIVLTVVIGYRSFDQPAYTLALGVVLGGACQVWIQLPALYKIGYRFRPCFDFFDEGLRKVLRLITPMIIGMSAGRVNILLSTLLASFLVEGSISYLNYSYRLMHFPLGVFAVALGTVTLPRVAELFARKDTEGLNRTFYETFNLNMFVVAPSAVCLAMLGRPIIELIYSWGAFTELHAANTTLALRHYAYGLIGFAAVRVTVPFFYAGGDSKRPMQISSILSNDKGARFCRTGSGDVNGWPGQWSAIDLLPAKQGSVCRLGSVGLEPGEDFGGRRSGFLHCGPYALAARTVRVKSCYSSDGPFCSVDHGGCSVFTVLPHVKGERTFQTGCPLETPPVNG